MKKFLMIQGILYMFIIIGDLGNHVSVHWSNGMKLISVWICFMYLLLSYRRNSSDRDHLLMIGVLAVTLLADTMLLFTNHLVAGLFLFIFVQLMYGYRIYMLNHVRNHYAYYIGALGMIFLGSFFTHNDRVLLTSVILYGVLFLMNLWFLVGVQTMDRQLYTLFKIGYILFLICDINVLSYNILPNYGISNLIYEFTRVSMWLFYLPAQVLLSLSAVMENPKRRIR